MQEETAETTPAGTGIGKQLVQLKKLHRVAPAAEETAATTPAEAPVAAALAAETC